MNTIHTGDQAIKTENNYCLALEEIEGLLGAPINSNESDRLEVLVTLVQGYEAKNYPIGPPSDNAAAEYEAAKRGTEVDAPADALRDGLLAAGETEDTLLADLRERRENESADIPGTVQEEIAALVGKSDKDIDFSDIPTTTDVDWDGAVRGKFYRGMQCPEQAR